MPKVSGKKTGKNSKTGGRARRTHKAPPPPTLSERISGFFNRLFQLFVTYTAVAVVGLIIIAILMLFAGGYFTNIGQRIVNLSKDVTRSAGLEITHITWAGATQTHSWDVLDALEEGLDDELAYSSILHFSTQGARERIEALGWVRHAAVTRLLPNTIHVSIEERIPAALWQRDGSGKLYLIDRDGAVITEVGGHQYTGLPMITETADPSRANEILTVLGDYPQLAARIGNLRYRGDRRWDMVLRNGFTVLLPEQDYEKAIRQVAVMEDKGKAGAMEKLDLRLSNAVYFVPKEE